MIKNKTKKQSTRQDFVLSSRAYGDVVFLQTHIRTNLWLLFGGFGGCQCGARG